MLKEYLKNNYAFNEPIFISEIQLDGMGDNTLRQTFKRMVQNGELNRFDTGIYYFPAPSRLLKKSYLDPVKVIVRKYIKNEQNVYGYFSGATFANQIGLTSQMPGTLEIVTMKESTKGRDVQIGSQSLRLKRSPIEINKENCGLLQFLTMVAQAEKYSELSEIETIALLRNYARKQSYSQSLLHSVLSAISGSTAKKLIEWGIIYEFAS